MSPHGTAVRLCVVAGAVAALAASASSTSNRPPPPPPPEAYGPPPQRAMEPELVLGLWKSSFGPVKIERDSEGPPGQLMGAWVYDRAGQEVVGTFGGALRGNVLQFRWLEPSAPRDLVGEGYLVFDPNGRNFSGRWWTAARDRGGDWNGWRAESDGTRGDEPPRSDEPPPDDEPLRRDDDGPDEGPPREGPAEQAPGPPPEEI